MANIPAPERRHALGMPAGSVRALLGLGVLGLLWVMALHNPDVLPPSFIYLMLLKLVILTHYFAAHGKSVGPQVSKRHALGLPRGSIRMLLLSGFMGLVAFLWYHSPKLELPGDTKRLYTLVGLLMGGFLVGYVVTGIFKLPTGQVPAWLQDVQAWLALLAVIGLGVIVMIVTVINPSLSENEPVAVDTIETGLAALIGFYFGARS